MKQYLIFGIVAVIIIVGAMMYRSSSTNQVSGDASVPLPSTASQDDLVRDPFLENNKKTMPNGLIIEDVKVGTGETAVKGALITVHYVGTLDNGTKFDSSRDRGEPFQFPLGQGYVIAGWDQGFDGMKVGGVRKLTIPSELGYGPRGAGSMIPPNATLHFEVELLGVRTK